MTHPVQDSPSAGSLWPKPAGARISTVRLQGGFRHERRNGGCGAGADRRRRDRRPEPGCRDARRPVAGGAGRAGCRVEPAGRRAGGAAQRHARAAGARPSRSCRAGRRGHPQVPVPRPARHAVVRHRSRRSLGGCGPVRRHYPGGAARRATAGFRPEPHQARGNVRAAA